MELASSLKPISLNRDRMWSFFSHLRKIRWVTPLFLVEINFPARSTGSADVLSHGNLKWASAALMRNFGSSLHISLTSGLNHSNP